MSASPYPSRVTLVAANQDSDALAAYGEPVGEAMLIRTEADMAAVLEAARAEFRVAGGPPVGYVYVLHDAAGTPVYVGESSNVFADRVFTHIRDARRGVGTRRIDRFLQDQVHAGHPVFYSVDGFWPAAGTPGLVDTRMRETVLIHVMGRLARGEGPLLNGRDELSYAGAAGAPGGYAFPPYRWSDACTG